MLQGLMRCFEAQNPSVHEILYYHKNSTGIWLEVVFGFEAGERPKGT